MKTFNYIISTILRISLIFLLFFIWVRYYVKSLTLVLIITSILTLLFDGFLNLLIKKKNIKASLKKEEIERAEGFCNYFIFNEKSVALNFFYNLLKDKYPAIKKSNFIIFEKNNIRVEKENQSANKNGDTTDANKEITLNVNARDAMENSINQNEMLVLYPFYKYNKLNIEDLIFIYNKTKNLKCEKVIICTSDFDEQVKKAITKMPKKFIILNKYEAYEQLMKKFEIYPTTQIKFNDETRFTFKNFLEVSLNKRRAGGYIFASIILFLSSFFVRVNIYYLIMSSILLLVSIFSFINPIYNKKTQEKVI
ncbi:MAG: hypothetical protein PHH71_01150 [Clostridia bacterium]|jgi:hypothetical protein|nr:hypothetical protein [Clostridia bacterium]MDD3232159.1 hypothetical protein [Clostridia bacterium]